MIDAQDLPEIDSPRLTDRDLCDELHDMMRRMWGLEVAIAGIQEDCVSEQAARGLAALAADIAGFQTSLHDRWEKEFETRKAEQDAQKARRT